MTKSERSKPLKGKPGRKRALARAKPKTHSAVPARPAKRIAVIGIGNPLMRDDGAGVSVLQLLSGVPKEVAIVDAGTGGIGLLHVLSDLDAAVIVDAVDFGGEPGEVRTFALSEVVSTKTLRGLSLHEGDILKIIEMARRIDQCPNEIVICAIEPEDISAGLGLSKHVKKAKPELARAVKEAVKKML